MQDAGVVLLTSERIMNGTRNEWLASGSLQQRTVGRLSLLQQRPQLFTASSFSFILSYIFQRPCDLSDCLSVCIVRASSRSLCLTDRTQRTTPTVSQLSRVRKRIPHDRPDRELGSAFSRGRARVFASWVLPPLAHLRKSRTRQLFPRLAATLRYDKSLFTERSTNKR